MDATEARKITNEFLRGPVIQPFLDQIHIRIQIAAKAGKFEIIEPFSSVSGKCPTHEEERAIFSEMVKLGYIITEQNSYPTVISW